ncbi:3-dehydroquinate synthase [Alkalicoccus chagannorensis]|uniref:3-dehydroquinate synthase n=1 Tax=Alkalicoccus chagannorensis TaxID=427072 RepID=UPI0003F58287|nr:3-dehydroquinate synthase [Alkalicoccus chagannorensis]
MTAESLWIQSQHHQYPVFVESGIRSRTGDLLASSCPGASSVLIAVDEHAAPLYLEEIKASFDQPPFVYVVPSGEQAKSEEEWSRLLTFALECGLDRTSVIIGLGGGVTGDLAGFAAASYMRGIRFIQMPTTLLAHDSSVGGKTGINHELGKNLIGAFHAPSAVFYDPDMLHSLPLKEWRSGYAEVLKHGWIRRPDLLEAWMQEIKHLPVTSGEKLNNLLLSSIQVKADIVEEDERESGIRAYLNFGHTLGHAVESAVGYGELTHGECVAVGMLFALRLSEEVYETKLHPASFEDYLEELGFTTSLPAGLSADALMKKMKLDKKAGAGELRFVLLQEAGKPELKHVDEAHVRDLLERSLS